MISSLPPRALGLWQAIGFGKPHGDRGCPRSNHLPAPGEPIIAHFSGEKCNRAGRPPGVDVMQSSSRSAGQGMVLGKPCPTRIWGDSKSPHRLAGSLREKVWRFGSTVAGPRPQPARKASRGHRIAIASPGCPTPSR